MPSGRFAGAELNPPPRLPLRKEEVGGGTPAARTVSPCARAWTWIQEGAALKANRIIISSMATC